MNWIAGSMGGKSGDRVVMGILNGVATIGSHNNALNTWSNLAINPDSYGNVSIGTNDAKGYRLAVNGNVIATSVTVKTNGNWPDYVFKPRYQAMPLAAVRDYINKNGHIPEVPLAAAVDQEGINIGEMNKLLLKKVEELTLYMIGKDQELKEANKRIDGLSKRLDGLMKK